MLLCIFIKKTEEALPKEFCSEVEADWPPSLVELGGLLALDDSVDADDTFKDSIEEEKRDVGAGLDEKVVLEDEEKEEEEDDEEEEEEDDTNG